MADAYRREDIPDAELGFASSLYINGYRIGMLLAGGGRLILADHIPFSLCSAMVSPGSSPLAGPGADNPGAAPRNPARGGCRSADRIFHPTRGALWVLALFCFTRSRGFMATTMTIPFYLDIGYTNTGNRR
ncbi:MAG: hypothetical protein R2860_15930 [Desulfobacterales bacterium]